MFLREILRRVHWWQLKRAGAKIPNIVWSDAAFFEGNARGFQCGRDTLICAGARLGVWSPGRLVIGDRFFMNHYAMVDYHDEI